MKYYNLYIVGIFINLWRKENKNGITSQHMTNLNFTMWAEWNWRLAMLLNKLNEARKRTNEIHSIKDGEPIESVPWNKLHITDDISNELWLLFGELFVFY